LTEHLFHQLQADKAYRDSMLWVPRRLVPVETLEAALTYWFSTTDEAGNALVDSLECWSMEARHVVLPREFPQEEVPCEVIDISTAAPTVTFRPDIAPRDAVQVEAMQAMRKARAGILNLACGRGKTVIALDRIAYGGGPGLVVVNNRGIQAQWRKEAMARLRLKSADLGMIGGDSSRKKELVEWEKPLVLVTVQTLWRRIVDNLVPEAVRRRFATVVFDEAHHMSAPKFNIASGFFTGDRFGLTATAERTDGNERFYLYHLGQVIYRNMDVDVPPTCYFGHTGITPTVAERNKFFVKDMVNIGRVREWQAKNVPRNRMIARLAKDAVDGGHKVLVLTHNKKDHISRLKKKLPRAGEVTGSVTGKARLKNLHENDVVVGTVAAAQEALDRPELSVGIWCTTFPNENEFQQGTGRLARAFEGKDEAQAIFLVDDVPICHDHARKLERYARKRGYRVEHFKLENP